MFVAMFFIIGVDSTLGGAAAADFIASGIQDC
jgi:hypothetical protein